jgi:ferredoxin
MTEKYKVVLDRTNCIGVLTCAAFYPERWAINKDDAKVDLVGGKEDPSSPGMWVAEFTKEELDRLKASAEVCPVNVIHIYNAETGEKLI